VWQHGGFICTGETYKKVKLTSPEAPRSGFLGPLQLQPRSNIRRAIIREGDTIGAEAFQGAHSGRRGAEHVPVDPQMVEGFGCAQRPPTLDPKAFRTAPEVVLEHALCLFGGGRGPDEG
jgi:hypothetical protein